MVQGGWLDTVNVYQHVMSAYHYEDQSQALVKRERIWRAIRKVIGQIPQSSKLIVAGDFNCNLEPLPSQVGTGVRRQAEATADREELVAIIQDQQLRAVNTYGKRNGCTYSHEGTKPVQRSFVDFIFTRRKSDGHCAAGCVGEWQVARWRGGGRHVPIWAKFQVQWFRAQKVETTTKWPGWKCKALMQVAKDNPDLSRSYQQQVAVELRQAGTYDPKQLNRLLLTVGERIFQIRRPSASSPPWESANHVCDIRTMWQHYRNMKQARIAGLSRTGLLKCIIDLWKHHAAFYKQHRYIQKQARCMRRHRLAQLVQEADAHNSAGCSQALFDLLRRVAPKQQRRRAQLRTKDGKLLTPAEEAEVLCQFWRTVNGGTASGETRGAHGYDLDQYAVAQALKQLQGGKSAPGIAHHMSSGN